MLKQSQLYDKLKINTTSASKLDSENYRSTDSLCAMIEINFSQMLGVHVTLQALEQSVYYVES